MNRATTHAAPHLRFVAEFTKQVAVEAQDRGYLSHVLVEFSEQKLYPVFFYDPTRLQQDLAEGVRCGHPFIADPGMIVIPEITLGAMRDAVEYLAKEGFFSHLVPINEEDLNSADPHRWPPEVVPSSDHVGLRSSSGD